MDKVAENIIAIRKRDISKANEAFADFMSLTEKCLNDKVKDILPQTVCRKLQAYVRLYRNYPQGNRQEQIYNVLRYDMVYFPLLDRLYGLPRVRLCRHKRQEQTHIYDDE